MDAAFSVSADPTIFWFSLNAPRAALQAPEPALWCWLPYQQSAVCTLSEQLSCLARQPEWCS